MTFQQKYWRPQNKYGNIKQTYEGYSYDSKFEAEYAAELDLRIKGKDIKSWDRQFKVSIDINGYHICNYYVDFLVYHNDGSKELVEVKGIETSTWKLKRKLLEAIYLPEHTDTTYLVVKKNDSWRNQTGKKIVKRKPRT